MSEDVAKNKVFPKLIENIADYDTFDPLEDGQCNRVISSMVDKALEIERKPPKIESKEGLIPLEEATKIAIEFAIKKTRAQRFFVSSVELKDDKWLVMGFTFSKPYGPSFKTPWVVEIEGEDVISYKFFPGKHVYLRP